ncbi:ABC transporter permease [Sneathiella chinensis]|uniref:ABC transporter permease n=1 Tax=Sneathiella chinensis TaxID=349750 RepID=A0ABQ5U8S2_9PROT|nr:ABC transporter permease [Sneathiella chinensis]GLQ07722.1 ABC transporter permease [Sneathiella chinensis]
MSLIAFLGAVELGFIYGLVALGIFISFRILNFPDLTVDGSFPLGAAVSASLIVAGFNPWVATLIAISAGCLAGFITAILNVKLKILHLLASILTMIALYSINLRIMGRPNVALITEETILTPFADLANTLGIASYMLMPVVFLLLAIIIKLALDWFLNSETGLAMRATGANPKMARANGIYDSRMILLGMAMANGLVALAGAVFAQSQGSADVTMGVGVIVIGLASVIGGEALLNPRSIMRATLACIVGSIVYWLAVSLALNADFIGLEAQDLKLVTAVLVAMALVLPGSRFAKMFRKKAGS